MPAWRTKFSCDVGMTNRAEDVGEMVKGSLAFEDVYGKKLVSPDRSADFRLKANEHREIEVVMNVTKMFQQISFSAPAYVCEERPGKLRAIVLAGQKHGCVPAFLCGSTAEKYSVEIEKGGGTAPADNNVVVSSDGLAPGVYTGVAGAAQ